MSNQYFDLGLTLTRYFFKRLFFAFFSIILWCLERDPKKRPSGKRLSSSPPLVSLADRSNFISMYGPAEELLSSELLPRKIELEERYLAEALDILTSSQVSERYW